MTKSTSASRRRWLLAAGATLLSAAALPVPVLALPAFLAVTLTFIALDGGARRLVGFVGAPLAAAAFVRFLLVFAVPNIVVAGERAAEDKAVSRLREIRWAEGEARQLKWRDSNSDGTSEYVPLSDLLKGTQSLLKAGLYQPVGQGGVVRTEAYDVVLYLPARGGGWTQLAADADPAGSSQRFIAYAWPVGERHGGARAFFIDQDEQICELQPSPYLGPGALPPPEGALNAMIGGKCPVGGTPGWHIWKKKKSGASPSDR